jgi:hypothetical protein
VSIDGGIATVASALIAVLATLVSQMFASFERDRQNARSAKERQDERESARRERSDTRHEEFLFRALEHFGGRTQERSVGIAIAEAYWRKVPDQVDVLVPVLLNQLVYLLTVADRSKTTAHELQNVARIVDLLAEIGQPDRFGNAYALARPALVAADTGSGIDLAASPLVQAKVDRFRTSLTGPGGGAGPTKSAAPPNSR